MKQTRVGTFSLGILLVAIGALILIGGIKGISGVLLILKFWPIILISIGVEILYFVYKNKGEEVRLKYDMLSVFVFIIILTISSGVFIFNEIMDDEISNVVMMDIRSRTHSDVMIKEHEFNKEDIDEINIKNSGNITISQSLDDKIRVKTSVLILASSEEIAREYRDKIIDIGEKNRVLFISDFNQESIESLIEIGEIRTTYEVSVPGNIDLYIDNNHGKVDISNLKNKLDFYLRGSDLNCYTIEGDIRVKGDYSNIDLDTIKGDVHLNMKGENITLNNILGRLSGTVQNYRLNIDGLNGDCDLILDGCNTEIKYEEKIQGKVNIQGYESNIEISIPKEQQGKFYMQTNRSLNLNSRSIFKQEDIGFLEDEEFIESRVIEKTIGEGPEIEINAEHGDLTIK